MAVETSPVPTFRASMATPGSGELSRSVTVPVMRLVVTSVWAKAGNASARTAITRGRTRDRKNVALLIKLLLSELNRKEQFRCLGFDGNLPDLRINGEKTFQEFRLRNAA